MAKKPPNSGKLWTPSQVRQIEELVAQNTPTRIIALKLGRTPASIQTKASEENISLKPTNQSPYGSSKKK